jgi:Fe2+ or Zn2+ uptake regulation protein
MTSVDQLLGKHELKKTALRRQLLQELMNSKAPLTQADLLERLGRKLETVDRVSVYRNLLQLKQFGLVHEVKANHYVVCAHECSTHPHLILACKNCQQHDEVKDHAQIGHAIKALRQFEFFSQEGPLFIVGVCTRCGSKGGL